MLWTLKLDWVKFSFFMYYLYNHQSVNFHQRSQPTTERLLITAATMQRCQQGQVWTDKCEDGLNKISLKNIRISGYLNIAQVTHGNLW